MKIIDKNGKVFGKISILDIMVLGLIIGLVFVCYFRYFSKDTITIINSNRKFYVTMAIEKVRNFTAEAINEGDMVYEQFQQVLGKAVSVKTDKAREIMKKPDGTAYYAEIEDKYTLYITLECSGNINDSGYYINGNKQVSVGSEIKLKTNNLMSTGRIYDISETLE